MTVSWLQVEAQTFKEKLPEKRILWRKIVTIAYMSLINFAITIVVAQLVVKIAPKYNAQSHKIINVLKLCICLILISLSAYFVRQIGTLTPKPFRTSFFNPDKVKETQSSILTAYTFFIQLNRLLQPYLVIFNI